MRKKFRVGIPVLCAVFLVGFMSCASFEKNTFRSLYGTGSIYNMGMITVRSYQNSGMITPEQRTAINKAALILKVSGVTAVNSFKAWKLAPNKEAKEELMTYLQSSIIGIATSFTEWQKVINLLVPNTVQGSYKLDPTVTPKAVTEWEDPSLKSRKSTFPTVPQKKLSSEKGIDPATISVIVSAIGIAIQYGLPQLSALLENMGKSSVTIEDIDGILLLFKDPETY